MILLKSWISSRPTRFQLDTNDMSVVITVKVRADFKTLKQMFDENVKAIFEETTCSFHRALWETTTTNKQNSNKLVDWLLLLQDCDKLIKLSFCAFLWQNIVISNPFGFSTSIMYDSKDL